MGSLKAEFCIPLFYLNRKENIFMLSEMKLKILIVDDEKDISDLLKYSLQKEGYQVNTAYDGEEAIEILKKITPNLVLLDIMMPKLDGWEIAKFIKSKSEFDMTSIIFLTAKSSEIDEVHGLRIGADDYILKPISIPKLLARIKLRIKDKSEKNQSQPQSKTVLKYKNIEIDIIKHLIKINGKSVFFPRKEFELLSFFIKNKGKVLPRELILNNIWGTDVFVIERTIDVHVRKVREKIGVMGKMIDTIKGVGYRLNDE